MTYLYISGTFEIQHFKCLWFQDSQWICYHPRSQDWRTLMMNPKFDLATHTLMVTFRASCLNQSCKYFHHNLLLTLWLSLIVFGYFRFPKIIGWKGEVFIFQWVSFFTIFCQFIRYTNWYFKIAEIRKNGLKHYKFLIELNKRIKLYWLLLNTN